MSDLNSYHQIFLMYLPSINLFENFKPPVKVYCDKMIVMSNFII